MYTNGVFGWNDAIVNVTNTAHAAMAITDPNMEISAVQLLLCVVVARYVLQQK